MAITTLCTEENISKIMEITKDENINIERNFMIDWMRIWADSFDIRNEELYIPDGCEQFGFVEGKYPIGQMLHFFADMLEE